MSVLAPGPGVHTDTCALVMELVYMRALEARAYGIESSNLSESTNPLVAEWYTRWSERPVPTGLQVRILSSGPIITPALSRDERPPEPIVLRGA